MIYLICFAVTIILILVIVAYGRAAGTNLTILITSLAVGCGGYYALSMSKCLSEALLANKLVYVTVTLAPMCAFLVMCGICRMAVRIAVCPSAGHHTISQS
ncbi:MAG: hypothetical protein IJV16_00850 [Lachnospiraceae bacterium]|nr:hypothetical protein [Lachnospiraceae bacterium]MBR1523653.1 hypothetical protein [Lachnospiraceae bacterium]